MKIPKQINKKKQAQSTGEAPKKSFLERDIELFPHKIADREKEMIYRQLNVLQKSGVDIRTCFEILFKQLKNKKTKEKLQLVLEELIKGKSLSGAVAGFSDFTPYEVFSLQIGEETGRLPIVLQKLTEYFENKIAQKRQVMSAISYPIMIVFTSFGAVSFMIFFIIPMFEEVFLRFNSELPSLTRMVIGFSHSLKANAKYFFVVLLSIGGLLYFYRKDMRLRLAKEWLIIRMPLIGDIYKEIYLARFCDSMSLLISASVPMIHTLEMVQKMIGFVHIEQVIGTIKTDLIQGKTLTKAFESHAIFDDQMKALIKVGEEVNQLGNFFQKLATDYTENVKHRTALFSTFLEPFMIIFLGLVVGLILVAMYLPMFQLSSNMNFGG